MFVAPLAALTELTLKNEPALTLGVANWVSEICGMTVPVAVTFNRPRMIAVPTVEVLAVASVVFAATL